MQGRDRIEQTGSSETQAHAAVREDELEFARIQLDVDRHRAQASMPAGERVCLRVAREELSEISYRSKIRLALPLRTLSRTPSGSASTRARQPIGSPIVCG